MSNNDEKDYFLDLLNSESINNLNEGIFLSLVTRQH